MSQIQTIILAIGGVQGFLLFMLLMSDKRVNYASKLLGIQCLLIATIFVNPLIADSGDNKFTWLIGLLLFLPACNGALVYLYCRTAITGTSLKYIDIFHLTPLIICWLLNYDILFSPENALSFVRMPETTLFRHTITKIVFYGQIVVYLLLLIRMLNHYQIKAKRTLSSYNPDVFMWLWSLVLFITLVWGLKIVFYFIIRVYSINILADFMLALMIYFIAIVQWRNPSLFHIQQLTGQLIDPMTSDNKPSSDNLLDKETRSNVLVMVQNQVKEQALYRNNELTLTTLAEQVGIGVHHLSETLNQQGGKNFNGFINEYRVAEVCRLLEQKCDRKLFDLALDAGFSSKSSFNAVFKKMTGKTPSIYRRQMNSHQKHKK